MKRMMKVVLAAAGIGLLLFSDAMAGDMPNMKEGKWEVTITMDMPGMPMQMPPVVTTQCITQKDLVPDGNNQQQNSDCDPANIKVNGDTVAWSIKCKTEGGTMNGNGTVTYKGTTFDGEMKMNQDGMAMNSKMKGKYIGPCSK